MEVGLDALEFAYFLEMVRGEGGGEKEKKMFGMFFFVGKIDMLAEEVEVKLEAREADDFMWVDFELMGKITRDEKIPECGLSKALCGRYPNSIGEGIVDGGWEIGPSFDSLKFFFD